MCIRDSPKYPAVFNNESLMVVASSAKPFFGNGGPSLSSFSNYSESLVDLAAPGSNVYSSVRNDRYQSYSGTSMASPNAAGVAAEVWSQYPEFTGVEIKEILMLSVTEVERFEGKMQAPGVVNLVKALEVAEELSE